MLTGNYLDLFNQLKKKNPQKRLIHNELLTLAYGTDASFYRLIPKLVVQVENDDEVIYVLKKCTDLKLPVTFRAAGTSLSGQSISDSVLVMLGTSWNKFKINEDASQISLQPGIIGAHANLFLAAYNKKIGPDPASINSAMIGGIAANNASGMCCGTAQNSYKTLSGMKIIFHDGSTLDTNDEKSKRDFLNSHGEIISRITSLSEQIKSNPELADRISRKFKMKNTTGFSLNAFVDFADPIEIIQHLMIGSEGTLGFISEITYNTLPELADKATSLMIFPDLICTSKAVAILKKQKVEAVELMDRAALHSIENKEGMPVYLKELDECVASLLVETRSVNSALLQVQVDEIINSLNDIPKVFPISFTTDKYEFNKLWDIRKGLFPSVGAMRKTGTTVIIEDVCFAVEQLAEAVADLQSLFKKHHYDDAIIFGHALEGNIHFVFKQDFNVDSEITRYKNFIDDVTKLVVKKYDGSLKAEHGTGRNMAPFVELEWGSEAYQLMKEIKSIFDPKGILNPGVILNSDSTAHIKNLKPLPSANSIIDKCIECGFCEINCPSKDLTLSPRQRIVAWREISRLQTTREDPILLETLVDEFDYYGNQTCATDGLCATSCPVEINTGNLIKELRVEKTSSTANTIADILANNMKGITASMRGMLNLVGIVHTIIGTTAMEFISKFLRRISGSKIPLWNKYMPHGADRIKTTSLNQKTELKVVYFPSCINRSMGLSKHSDEKKSLTTTTYLLLRKAGYEVIYPNNLSNLCCGMAFASKGFKKQGDAKAKELIEELQKISDNGKLPILFDMSPCLYRTKEYLSNHQPNKFSDQFKIYEPVEFISNFLMDKLIFKKLSETIVIHSTCSNTKLGLTEQLIKISEACAEKVINPYNVGCCGWAGDRGFTYPELNESALMNLKSSISDDCKHGYSTSKTCEIGLSLHSGINYESIINLVDKCTDPKVIS
ncbi:MAG: FAD-binding and (Fe-S)-binding domain-containing protein [Ignavibacteriales bacterium]|nr:FAD-binding and (Fe-S)-binding domain-containing protein [Ignavibacteriales bacterium]